MSNLNYIHMPLDPTDWRILEELQEDARISFSELGRRVGLSAPAVAERVKRLESAGIICGYHAEVNLEALGLPITAYVHMNSNSGESVKERVTQLLEEMPESLEWHDVTGNDCFIIRIAVRSIPHLEQVLQKFRRFGRTTTSIILSSSGHRIIRSF
jgi:Lrp/AsnC family transcriptional regulator, leucine-responsive regulatory protein